MLLFSGGWMYRTLFVDALVFLFKFLQVVIVVQRRGVVDILPQQQMRKTPAAWHPLL